VYIVQSCFVEREREREKEKDGDYFDPKFLRHNEESSDETN